MTAVDVVWWGLTYIGSPVALLALAGIVLWLFFVAMHGAVLLNDDEPEG